MRKTDEWIDPSEHFDPRDPEIRKTWEGWSARFDEEPELGPTSDHDANATAEDELDASSLKR